MPNTGEALAIALLFLAPGLLYDLGLSVRTPYRRPDPADRLWRAFSYSLLLQALALPGTFLLWRRYTAADLGEPSLIDVWPLLLAAGLYVAIPFTGGLVSGERKRRSRAGVPSAWDHVFGTMESGYVRVRLKTGQWMGGVYGVEEALAFASGYPDLQSLYLPFQLVVDEDSGEIATDAEGRPVLREWGLLLQGADVERVEIQATKMRW